MSQAVIEIMFLTHSHLCVIKIRKSVLGQDKLRETKRVIRTICIPPLNTLNTILVRQVLSLFVLH